MDSGNSGSLQSSSGGDEEYDSRAADSFFSGDGGGGLSVPAPSFDPISNFMQLSQNPNPLFLNPWPGSESIRADPNPSTSQEFNNPFLPGSPVFQQPAAVGETNGSAPAVHQAAPRNPRKRSRASRRAPTTVLTTDTTNFRAMVQEFTGIPAPPFNSSSLIPRSRFDLFGGARSAATALEPPYLRRPFAQKVQSPPFPANSSGANGGGMIPQTPNLFNLPNPILNSLLQSNPKFFPNSQKPNPVEIPSKIDGLDELGFAGGGHADQGIAGLPNLISSDQIGAPKNPDQSNNGENDEFSHGEYGFARSPAVSKSAVPAASSAEKAPENVVGREGMVESWICSSE